jgi:C_GCAxxG_C_C family probable redox protein
LKTKGDIAQDKFLAGYNCSQAVLHAFSEDLGLDGDTALRIACGLGAGMARRQEVCGAVTGGIIAIGLKHGRGEGQERAVTEAAYLKVREFMGQFESKNGSCICRNLLKGCDLATPEGQRHYIENDLLNQTCAFCVRTAAEAVENVI